MENLIAFILTTVFGTFFLYAYFYLKRKYDRLEINGRKTTAIIIEQKKVVGSDQDGYKTTFYYPVIKFTNSSQETITQLLDVSRSWKWKLESIQIIYLEKEDKTYDILVNNKLWREIIPLLFLVTGSFVLLLSMYILWYSLYSN